MLGATRRIGCPKLASHHSFPHPVQVGVRPFAGGPGRRELNICREIYFVQFIVDKLSNVPRKIIVSEIVLKNIFSGLENYI